MTICDHCGQEIEDEEVQMCEHCGVDGFGNCCIPWEFHGCPEPPDEDEEEPSE